MDQDDVTKVTKLLDHAQRLVERANDNPNPAAATADAAVSAAYSNLAIAAILFSRETP